VELLICSERQTWVAGGQGLPDPQTRLSVRSAGEWSDDDYDVLADGVVVGRIFMPEVLPGLPWMWTLIFPYHEDRSPTCGYAASREDAMGAFAKSWRRE
jgi:hypothetical protein